MKHILYLIMACSLLVVAGQAISEEEAYEPAPDADKTWMWITKVSPYTGYKFWPDKDGFYEGTEPHGAILRTFVNPRAYTDITEKKGMFSHGAVIVKENYNKDKNLMAITIMRKIKGYDPEHNDWYWVKYGPQGKALKSGKVEACINCHKEAKDNDYCFTGPLK